jgi:hypothetical protein
LISYFDWTTVIEHTMSFPTCRRNLADVLSTAQSGRFVLQDFAPLAESLEWELGGRYLSGRGSLAFLSDPVPVPYAVNNSGSLSREAAEVFFATLETQAVTGDIVGPRRLPGTAAATGARPGRRR